MKKQVEFMKNGEVVGKAVFYLKEKKSTRLMIEEATKLNADSIRVEKSFIIKIETLTK